MWPLASALKCNKLMMVADNFTRECETHVSAAECMAQSVFTVVRTCRMVSMCQRWEGAYLTETETHTANSAQWYLRVSQEVTTSAFYSCLHTQTQTHTYKYTVHQAVE